MGSVKDIKRVVVFSAHPDDAEITVGGTLALLSDSGHEVTVWNMTTSEMSDGGAERRRAAAGRAAEILGYELRWFQEGRFQQVEEIEEFQLVRALDSILDAERPDVVFTHWEGDSHGDHVRLSRAVIASSRRTLADLYLLPPSECEAPHFHAFVPNTFVDVSAMLERKLEAIAQYEYPGRGFRLPSPHAIRALAGAVGASMGCVAGEAMQLLRLRGVAVRALGV